jgi:hypothetical protein
LIPWIIIIMGTRGQFFLYVVIKGKRVLVYASYSQYDGYEWLLEGYALLQKLLAAREGWTVSELGTEMSVTYKREIYFAGDTEACCSVSFELEQTLDTLPEDMESIPEYFTSYGYSITGYGGGCYYHEVIPETIANSVVSGITDTVAKPSDAFKAAAEATMAKMSSRSKKKSKVV